MRWLPYKLQNVQRKRVLIFKFIFYLQVTKRMLKNSSPQLHFGFYSRQNQLEKQNQKLKNQLKTSRQLITKLRSEIEELKNQLNILHLENIHLHEKQESVTASQVLPRSPKSNKSIKMTKDFNDQMQIFTSESDSQTEQNCDFKPTFSVIHPLGKDKQKSSYFESQKGSLIIAKQLSSQIKLRGKVSNEKRSLKKVDSSNVFRPVTYFDVDPDEDNTFSSVSPRHLQKQSCVSMNVINLAKSQKLIPKMNTNQNSHIKAEGKIGSPNHQKVFKKVSIGKPIYDVFFVTGLNTKSQPEVIFSYPRNSLHFEPILSICYSDEFLRTKDNNSTSSKNLINVASQSNTGKIRQFYVIPLRKLDADSQNEREYLTICQVEEITLVGKQNMLVPCVFQRLYCFISGSQFFTAFKNLTNQFLDKINGMKTQMKQAYITEQKYKEVLRQSLEQPLMILSQKSAESNHTLSYRLDSFVSVSIDIPSLDNSYKLISQYRPWGVMNFKVQIRPNEEYISSLQTKLFGVLLVYVLSEKKVILFSTSKSKISECILHLLQIIKPLEYVCPIIMTVLKEQHEEYFSAPMSLILGLWVEQRKMQRQKIEIFMNRKENLAGMIQKGKILIQDGVIINLDTGLIYGGGLSEALTATGVALNDYYENYCHHPKDIFKLFDKLFDKELTKNQLELIEIQHKLHLILHETQLFTYYNQKINRKNHFSP